MRVPLPSTPVLLQADLRREVQARLAERRAAEGIRLGDPTDPGWLLIEEAAWRVEGISREAGRFPARVAMEVAGMLGATPAPALPAIGVMLLAPERHGVLERGLEAEELLFLSAHTEGRSGVPFAMVEPRVPLCAGGIGGPGETPDAISRRLVTVPAKASPEDQELNAVRIVSLTGPLPGVVRVGMLVPRDQDPTPRSGSIRGAALLWRLAVEAGHVVAFDLSVNFGVTELVLAWPRAPEQVWLNPVLAINAPRRPDGRAVSVPSVGAARLDVPDGDPLFVEALHTLQARFIQAPGQKNLIAEADLHAFDVEAEHPIHAAADAGRRAVLLRRAEPGPEPMSARLRWARITDGAAGNVPAGAINLFQVHGPATPDLLRVLNPLAFEGGRDRERVSVALERIYNQGLMPLRTFEAEMARRLRRAGLPWQVRLWSQTDRHLHDLWTWEELEPASPAQDAGGPERSPVASMLLGRGHLVAVVGPAEGAHDDKDLQRAREVLKAWFHEARLSHPGLRELAVRPLFALRVRQLRAPRGRQAGPQPQPLPKDSFPTHSLMRLHPEDLLVDAHGRLRHVRVGAALLDAVIIGEDLGWRPR